MKPVINYISVCSGIEAASVAMSRIPDVDWRPVAFSEIDPFACSVLAYHFPAVPNLGDLSKIRYDKEHDELTNGTDSIPLHGRRIHAILGGTPCQSVSNAGLRHGMQKGSGTRSSLFYEYVRLIDEIRPDWILWENVPGVLSSRDGRDFYAVQDSLVNCGYGLAWRVLDAQYAVVDGFPRAVPQRRKRVWLVGCAGGNEHAAAQILFERPSILGDTPPSREAGKGFACPVGYRVAGNDRLVGVTAKSCGNGQLNQTEPEEVAKTLDTMHDAQTVCIGKEAYNIGEAGQGSLNISEDGTAQTVRADTHPSAVAVATFENHAQDSRVRPTDAMPTMGASNANSAGVSGNNPLVVFSKASHARNKNGDGERYEASEVAQTRNTFDNGESRAQEVVCSAVGFSHSNSNTSIQTKPTPECSMTLRSVPTGEGAAVISVDRLNQSTADEVMHTIKANCATGDGEPTAALCLDAYNQKADEETCMTLRSAMTGTDGNDADPKIAVGVDTFNQTLTGDVSRTLNSSATDTDHIPVVLHHIVRRLTVIECSRLQGFPDLWLKFPTGHMRKIDKAEYDYLYGIPELRKYLRTPADSLRGCYETELPADSAAYKALGNSMATNCVEWILRRIVAAYRLGII